MPYKRGESILSYDKTNDKIYVKLNDGIYYVQNNTFTKLATFNGFDANEGDTFVFAEDNKKLYYALSGSANNDVCHQVDKFTGENKSIYKTIPNEKMLFITPQYFVTYKKGSIYKYKLSDSSLIDKRILFDGKESIFSNLQISCTGNYLFANKDNKLSIINLDKMREIKIS